MSGERSSTTRMRERGQICCKCHSPLPPIYAERYCRGCATLHRVYMHFMLAKGGWHVQFLEQDLKTPLRRKFTFQDPAKIMDLAIRGGADSTSADKQALEHAFSVGRGGVRLNLNAEQYGKLKR